MSMQYMISQHDLFANCNGKHFVGHCKKTISSGNLFLAKKFIRISQMKSLF